MTARTVTTLLDAPKQDVFSFLAEVENLPRWATEFIQDVRKEAGDTRVVTPLGELYFEIRADEATGVIDMLAGPVREELGLFPTRVVELPGGKSVYSFTMIQAPDQPDEVFESQYESLLRELENLRAEFARPS